MTAKTSWPSYVRSYHATHAGITEHVLTHCDGDPYGWLLEAVPNPPVRLLDLACGSAPLLPRLTGATYLGVDFSAAELSLAHARGQASLVRADATRLPLAPGSIDTAVCSMALQVLTPLHTVLDELRRVLRPGGTLIALLPVSAPLTLADRSRYSHILWQLRRPRLGYANPHVPERLTRAGWTVLSSRARRFSYQLREPADGHRLVESFYLPGSTPERQQAAAALVSSWSGLELGIPLRRVVATAPGAPQQPRSHRLGKAGRSGRVPHP